ncbi:alpha/beta hydrolase [candidate division KSB1 bacterium]
MEVFWKALVYIAVFIIGFVAISLWNFYMVIHPPEITGSRVPSDLNLPENEVIIESSDGTKLSAWLMESLTSKKSKRALIILHGYPAEKSDMLSIASILYPDFTLLLPDARSFGKSEGSYTTLGIKERADTRAAIDFLEVNGYEKIGIFGFSVGGAVGILTAAEDDRVGAVASYASFSDVKTLGEDVYTSLWILKKPMVALMLTWSKLFLKESLVNVSPLKAIEGLRIPLFITHTEADEVTPFSHALRLQRASHDNENAEFYFQKEEIHGELPPEFHTKLNVFFNQSL